MAKIILIETSTALCSVALEIDGTVVSSRVSGAERSHASMTAVYCKEVLDEAGIAPADLDAVCISDGPGSYTGLRVGLSTAKGLCFGTGAKLVSVSSLDVLAGMGMMSAFGRSPAFPGPSHCVLVPSQASLGPSPYSPGVERVFTESPVDFRPEQEGFSPSGDTVQGNAGDTPFATIIPMLDARRMEVYTARYDMNGVRTSPIEAVVVDSDSFRDVAADALFIGDGALKCKDVIGAGRFVEAYPVASAMATLAEKEYAAENFRDVAYFEPFYLKDFVVTESKKKLF